ncbi:MAG: helix-turn-helix transcriptional regulator [Prevotella sp.]|nr:helix-turn-helix transcriptional regulator [Prevotella sp.]
MKPEASRHNAHKGHRLPLRNFNIAYQDDDILLISSIELDSIPAPLKAPRNIFYFCHNGSMNIETPDGKYLLRAGDTFVCPTGTYVKIECLGDDTKFSALSLTDRLIQSLLNTNIHIWNNIVYVLKERLVPTTDGDNEMHRKMGWHFSELMRALLPMKDRPLFREMIYLMLQMVLLGFCAHHKETAKDSGACEKDSPQAQIIFSKFMVMLQNEPVKHRPIYYYADRLCISSKYLSYVCKAVSGKSAGEFIQSAVVGEIMHYLDHTTLSPKEIAARMGFVNLSCFGKFVKTHLGLSPNKYRK